MTKMNLSVVVLDYDGTIAHNGVLHPEVRAAIAEIRASGLTVVLATGRILRDLQRLLGDLRLVDAVVAENGAVLAFPESGRSTAFGAAPASFVESLRRRNVQVAVGECVVETDASAAPIVLDLVRQMELPLVLAFNAGRLMVLPQGISKATGLNAALRALRLSEHNAIAIGDAAGVVLLTRTTDFAGLQALKAEGVADRVGRLSLGEAMLLPTCDESPNQPLAFRIAPRLTEHVRHRQKYLDVPVADRYAFVFTSHNRPIGCKVQTLTEFSAFLGECPPQVLAGHLDRGDVSRWVGDVFGDHVLARRIHELEQLHRLGRPLDAADALRQLVGERYTLVPPM